MSNEVNVPSQSGSTINSSNGYNPGGLSPENKKILCTAICKCEKSPNIGKTGNQLKQSCVSSALNQLDKILYNRSTIKPEINYDMTQTLSAPIMSRGNPLSGTEYLPNRVIDNPGFTPNSGMVRRPDVVIVKDQTQPPVQENIKNVVEIKFPGDSYTEKQQLAYEKIAGDPNKVSTLSPCDCDCDQNDKERKAAEDKAKQVGTALTLVEILLIILSGGKFVPSRGGVVPGLAPI